MCKISDTKNKENTLFIKVFEVNIYQVSVKTRQAAVTNVFACPLYTLE
jgi:hypothetical protein